MPPPTQRDLFSFFLPLALSGIFFPLARPIINAALARTDAPAIALATYAVAISVSTPFLSPLFALRQVSTALAQDRRILRRIRKLTWLLGCVATAVLLLICIPSVYGPVVEGAMGIPHEIARLGPPVLVVFAASALLSVGRGYFQGILVHYRKAGPIGTGALIYLLATTATMVAGVSWTRLDGALLAALALGVGQSAYLIGVWLPARDIIRNRIPERSEKVGSRQATDRYIFYFYLPLAVSVVMLSLVEPAIQAGMARVLLARSSLAAYPVCISLIWLAGTPLWNAQQLAIAQIKGRASFAAVARFIMGMSLLLTVGMGLIAFTPLAEFTFGRLMGVTGQIKHLAIDGFRWLVPMPLFLGARSLYQGTLIGRQQPARIQSATAIRTLALLAVLACGVAYGEVTGLYLAVWATLASSVAEVLWLHRYTRNLFWR